MHDSSEHDSKSSSHGNQYAAFRTNDGQAYPEHIVVFREDTNRSQAKRQIEQLDNASRPEPMYPRDVQKAIKDVVTQAPLAQDGITVSLQGDDMMRWDVFMNADGIIGALDNATLEFEVRLPALFPFNPPFIRLLRPRLKNLTGHITAGGSVCTEMLTTSGWNPTYSMRTVLLTVKMLLVDGGAEVADYNSSYSYEEAMRAFKRVANDHGWQR